MSQRKHQSFKSIKNFFVCVSFGRLRLFFCWFPGYCSYFVIARGGRLKYRGETMLLCYYLPNKAHCYGLLVASVSPLASVYVLFRAEDREVEGQHQGHRGGQRSEPPPTLIKVGPFDMYIFNFCEEKKSLGQCGKKLTQSLKMTRGSLLLLISSALS